ncbi:MAG TPA: hypothetical protein VF470_09735 [Sphingomicrobium sp.]
MPTFEHTLERNGREYTVEASYAIHPGHPATRLSPAEPETVELVHWTLLDADFDLTARELDALQDEAEEHAVEAIAEMRDEAAEAWRMEREERRWAA